VQGLLLSLLIVGLPQESPPGLRLVAGGATKVGSRVADVERWLREGDRTFASFLAGETPQFEADVEDFHLMVTEVTQEQYAAHVAATGVRPPFHWSPGPVEAARQAFLEAEGRREPDATRRRTWDPDRWWDANWEAGHTWALSEEDLARPVVNVSQHEAAAYARWAGLRLMDEEEFARACRADTDRVYPWGDDWIEAACNSIYLELGGPVAVGRFARGAVDGILDLSGNVWEWTSSPYRAFDGYELIRVTRIEAGRSFEVEALAPFDPAERVAVGGSYLQGKIGLHAASRRAKEPGRREPYLGFRCAASVTPGFDAAAAVIDEELARSFVPEDVAFDSRRTAIHQRWSSKPGKAEVSGYAVITGYERVLFCPVRSLGVATRVALARKSTERPVLLGFLSVSRPLSAPALDAGTYLVAWRSPGRLAELDPLAAVPDLDPAASCLILYDLAGLPVAAVRAGEATFGRLSGPSEISASGTGLRLTLSVPGLRREGLGAELELLLLQDR